MNDLLTLLQSDEKALDILKSNSSSFFIELRELWLAKKLENLDIEFTTEDLKTLNQYIPYRAEVINDSLEKVKDTAEIKELTAFFATLANCGFTRQTNEYFLTNEIVNTTNVSEWRIKLADKLVGILLNSKFPSYNNYFKGDNYNFKLKTAFTENAYNQADTTYWYSADDIAQISSELMQDFEDFKITQALGQQEDRSLETILTEVLVEYKQDKQPTFIPLNIAGNHWVSLALIHDQGKDVALYKDSLGEDNDVAEREKVREILSEALTNLDFRYHNSYDQLDGHNCGVFTLANIKDMAKQVKINQKFFIENFEKYNFITQEEATKLRREAFPKMYALSLCQPYKRREVTNHHSAELQAIKKLLLEKNVGCPIVLGEENKPENGLRISIALPQEENLLKKDYQYIYVIEADKNVDFSQNSELKSKITEELEITEIYSTEGNIIKILGEKLTAPIQKQQKLDLSQLTLKTSGNEIKELLGQLSVEATNINKDILRINLGLPQEEDLSHKSDNIINIKDYQLLNDLHKKLTKILASGWSIDSVRQLIAHVDSKEKLQNLLNSIDPIYEYKLKEYDSNIKGKSLLAIFRDDSPAKWAKEIHDLAIFQTFKGSYDKKLAQLKDEILELNRDQDISFLQDEQLITGYKEVNLAYSNKSVLFPYSDIIQNWTKKEIKQWSAQVKYETDSVVSQYEKIAVVKRAVEVTGEEAGRKISPRDIQLLSVLIMLNHEKDKGRLAQINTGEGKTTIVAMLTAIKALEGHKVDIITSSPELAKPQAIQQKKFFDKFGFTVSHNGKDEIDIKERYKADIVYGSASDFQGDILRDEYSKLGTRSGRKCDIAIVDEVDSMLIDGKNHIVMLSSPMPAMDHLEPLLSAIWIQIGEVAKCIKENNGKAFYVEPQDMIGNDGKLKSGIVEQAYLIEGTKEEFIKNCTEKHIRKMLRDVENLLEDDKIIPSEYPEIKIPEHLRQLVTEVQIPKWIDSAIHAKYRCENGKHYILKDGKIAPVDANNTGVVQANMHWSNGLHQFLQIKHGTKITAESLTTNFVSNVTYFKRYGHNIYGLTGTLGSNNARELLNKTYEVDSVIIPPFRQKQYQELTPIITNKENGWYNNIVESSINKLNNGRGVLVITKYIKEVDEIKNRLISAGYDASKIKLYKDERDAHVIEEELKPGEIIIATNIAGRGTDIKADKIEKNGGLHVCITFLPPNERVEQQNVGRTSRTGNRGTSQLILLEARENDLNKLRTIRDIQEEYALKNAGTEIERVTIKDALFVEFCNLLSELEAPNTKEIVFGLKNQLLQSKVDYQDITDKIKIRAIEERFGIWLKRQEADIATGKIKKEEILSNFKKFKQQILNDKANDNLIKNPYFHVLSGNKLLEGEIKYNHVMSGEELREGKNNKKAIEEFTRAIELDKHFQANAYYNRGYARIAEYGGDAEKHKEQIVKAIADFKEAKRIIEENLEPMLHVIQKASNSEALSEQVSHKMTLFGIQKNAIASAIGTGIGSVDKEIEVLESQKKQPGLIPKDIEAINKQIESLKENKAAREKGVIGQAMAQKRDLKIELVDIAKSLPEDQDINLYKEEIDEYKNNGFRGSFQVTEVKPIDWLSVIGVGAIALAQLVGGAALAVFTLGAGSTIGMGLMSEGVADLITMVKDGIINRNFSWESYGIQKAISMTVSLVCAGFKAIKDVAKTAYAGMKSIQTAMTTTVKAGWQLAAKAMGVSLAKGVAKELVTQLVDYGVNQALMPSIQQEVMKRIEKPIQDALLKNPNVKKMLELDGKNRNNYYQNLIKNKAMELLNPQQDKEHALLTITKGIAKGIATNKIQGLSTILQIDDAIQALDKLDEFVPNFIDSLNKVIEELSKNEKVDEKFMEFNKQNLINTQETDNEKHDVNYTSNYIPEKEEGDIEDKIGKDTNDEEQIQLERGNKSPEELRKGLASSVSVNMCNIIQSKLITPLTHAGIDYGMNKLTAGLDKHIQDGIGNFQAERRIEFFQDGDKDSRIDEEFKQGIHDKTAVAKADSMIDDLKKGGEAGLPHLGPLSDEAGRPIKVLDEHGNHVRTIGGDKGGEPIEVQYHKPNKDNPSGHWTLPGGKDAPSSGEKNCLFDVVAAQTKKDPNQLRANTAQRMENNKAMVANQAHDIKRLEQYKKDALTMGGAKVKVHDDSKTSTNIITVNLSKDNLKDVLADPLFEDCTLTGYGAVTFHAEGTDQEEKCRPIDDFDFVVTSQEQFDKFVINANNDPNVSKKSERSLGTDKNGKICSFSYKIGDNQFVEMSVVLPGSNKIATDTKKLYNANVKTLTELKKDKTHSQGYTKGHKRDNSLTKYQIRDNDTSNYYRKHEKEQKDIEQINIINNLLKQEEESSKQSNV